MMDSIKVYGKIFAPAVFELQKLVSDIGMAIQVVFMMNLTRGLTK